MSEQLISVGIDIGTSTTQVIFSRLTIDNTASAYAVPHVAITDKRTVYRSPVYWTPLVGDDEIDERAVRAIVEQEFESAGFTPDSVRTGAVIITGETARKENAARVLSAVSGLAGDFVVATAGPELESIIAGKGAGTASLSERRPGTFANIDIGGGTTNIAFFKAGVPLDTCCLDVGGRLIRVDASGNVSYIAPKVLKLCDTHRIPLSIGGKAELHLLCSLCGILAQSIAQAVGFLTPVNDNTRLLVADHLPKAGIVPDFVTFSGGVADCVYEDKTDDFAYGDIGVLLGGAISEVFVPFRHRIEKSAETIRATVIGVGTHATELSGSTITYTQNLFPLKNIPIAAIADEEEALRDGVFSEKLRDTFRIYGGAAANIPVALALRGRRNARFAYIQLLADGLCSGMNQVIEGSGPLIILIENDMGKVLGQALRVRLPGKDIVCLDMLKAEPGDYIDIGAPVADGRALPVVIKSLIFN